jgi:glucans biosynthesis protein C
MGTKFISARRYELDWLRVFAIIVLLLFHTGRIFSIEDWYVKNAEVSANFGYWMFFVHTWRMPMLLFISGAGSYFAFKSSLPFLIQRSRRLIIPLIFGMIAVLPLHFYFHHITEVGNVWDIYNSFFDFFPFYNGVPTLYNLWFLQHLFLYSLIALPILIFLRSAHWVAFRMRFMRYFFNPLALLLISPILITLTQLALLPNYPGRASFVFFLTFFLLGIILYNRSEYLEIIGKNRKYFLVASILILIPFYLYYPIQGKTSFSGRLPVGLALETFVGWFWIITIIAFGRYYFSRPHPWLTMIGDGLISFYILHQTVLVAIGYYMCKLPWGINAKFWSINLLTSAFCVSFYFLCIRPFNVMRIAFGMKLKPAPSRVSPAVPD